MVNINLFCDNKSVIKGINDSKRQCRAVNQSREDDIDIEVRVAEEMIMLKNANCVAEKHYAKGHQRSQENYWHVNSCGKYECDGRSSYNRSSFGKGKDWIYLFCNEESEFEIEQ